MEGAQKHGCDCPYTGQSWRFDTEEEFVNYVKSGQLGADSAVALDDLLEGIVWRQKGSVRTTRDQYVEQFKQNWVETDARQ